ncbi:hypothetical protein N7495_004802 [Penicillium taxi]|uniref:uncharacterized protein n=1 Tax=Penicillium taxi TaxID=168475 RepID=UPI002545231E|nr:uncharacterized protein N7495_004802 [Penicillium taxi]KAJ5900058.1 hypothetical protein N7495_004802 [Penicillium taxi]
MSEDKTIAKIRGGAVWDHGYAQLVLYNLAVMGSELEVSPPEVSGITFHACECGFSCDNVFGYEVVFGSGEVIYADEGSRHDLWLTLKGGSNNFGIITRFDVAMIPQEQMCDFMKPGNFDSAATMGVFLDYSVGEFLLSDAMWYTKDVEKPDVYDAFTEIPNLGGLSELNTTDNIVEVFGKDIPSDEKR